MNQESNKSYIMCYSSVCGKRKHVSWVARTQACRQNVVHNSGSWSTLEQHGFELLGSTYQQVIGMCAQSFSTLCHPMACSPPASSVHGLSQVRVLEWVAISFSRGSSHPRDQTIFCIAMWILYHCTTSEAGGPNYLWIFLNDKMLLCYTAHI